MNMYKHLKPVKKNSGGADWKRACYQYFIDHGVWTGKYWQCTIHFENQADLEWRIKARMKGVLRNDEEAAKHEVEVFLSDFGNFKTETRRRSVFDNKLAKLQHGTPLNRLIALVYHKCVDYIDKTTL
jgi:hypothetical protein